MLEVSLITTPWEKMASGWPSSEGEYLVVIQTKECHRYAVLTYYDKKHRRFEYYDSYDDTINYYYKKDVFAWMKVPDYKNL